MSDNILVAEGITKSFPGVKALKNVDFHLERGEVRAVVGKNGAGKSTLIKIITGIYGHDSGELSINGSRIPHVTPKTMHELGVRAIYQTNDLVPYFSVAEAIMLNNEQTIFGGLFIDRKRSHEIAARILEEQLNVSIDTTVLIRDLDVSQQQLVQIAQNLVSVPSIMILDEPTAALSAHEIDRLFDTIGTLKRQGVSIVYISHRFDEIFRVADSVTVLRDGEKMADLAIADTTDSEVIRLMVGEATERYARGKRAVVPADTVLAVSGLSGERFQNVSFSISKGEIVGLFGGEGAGQQNVGQAIFGRYPVHGGTISVDGAQKRINSSSAAITAGIGYVPRDRKEEGLVIDFDVSENITLPTVELFAKFGLVDRDREEAVTSEQIDSLSIKTPSARTPVATLSGGNQQKVVLGRWIVASPKVLILDYPTSGIDVKAKVEVYTILKRLTDEGVSILLISPEYAEIETLCDRVFVMRQGNIVKEFSAEEFDEHDMLSYAIGSAGKEEQHD